jgi:MFS family permease
MPRSPLFPIFLTVFVDVLGLTLMIPLLPFYAEHFNASPIVVGTLMASYAACQGLAGPILGRLSDRFGRKPVLLVSQMGTFAGFIVLALANSLWMLFLGRIIDGLTAGNLTTAQAYISDVTKPEERTRAFGFIGIAFGTGFLIGPAISGLLADLFKAPGATQPNFSAPAYGAAALSFTSILCTAIFLPRVAPKPAGAKPGAVAGASRSAAFREYFRRPASRRRLLEFFAFVLSFSTLIGGLALFLERRFEFKVRETGYLLGFSGLIGAIIQGGFIGRLVKRLGEEKLTFFGFATMLVGYGFLGFANSLPVLLVLVAISGFGIAVTRPSITTMLTKSVGPHEQGAALGVSQSLQSIASMFGPLAAGFLIQHGQLAAYGFVAGGFALAGLLLQLQPAPKVSEA